MSVQTFRTEAATVRRRPLTPDVWAGVVLFALLLVVYNANGREIPSYDSQPTKFAARELLLRGTLGLNHVVGAAPLLTERPAFVLARDGRYRSAYSPVPSVAAAAITWPVWKAGAVDVRGPNGAQVIAVVGASAQTAAAVVLAFFTVRRRISRLAALSLASVLGVGTGYWHTVSQTLWQHESAILGLALAVFALAAVRKDSGAPLLAVLGIGLALAVTSRLQLAPAVLVLLAATVFAAGARRALIPLAITAAGIAVLLACNVRWFGSPMGALPLLEALHPAVHATERSFNPSAGGFLGLLVSPNRGLLVYCPIAAVVLLAIRRRSRDEAILQWCGLAALVQYAAYGSYGVWWGGHTYGPRYMLDVLPLLVPLAASTVGLIRTSRPLATLAAAAAVWSVVVAGTGAFVYPDERWNVDPRDVDRHHERLWDWSDLQIVRCWGTGSNTRNFNLFVRNTHDPPTPSAAAVPPPMNVEF